METPPIRPRRAICGGDGLALLFKNVGDDDVIAGTGEGKAGCLADADAAAGDQDSLGHQKSPMS